MTITRHSPLRDAITQYLRHVELLVNNEQRAPGTLKRLRHELARVAPELGDRRRRPWRSLGKIRLEHLEPSHIFDWFDDCAEHSTHASASQSLVALRTVLYWVRRRGILQWNPAAKLGLVHESEPGEPLMPGELAKVRGVLADIEAELVSWHSRRRNPLARVGATSAVQSIHLLEVTGARLEEATGLLVREVHLAEACILRGETKTGPRAIPLGPEACDLLERQLRLLAGRFEHVFPSPQRPVAPISARSVEKLFRRACRLAGLDRHVHDLRHTYAFLALSSGTPIEALSLAMGHRCLRTTKQVYGRHNLLTPQSRQVARTVELARRLSRKEVPDVAA